jgi:hypothetical protein
MLDEGRREEPIGTTAAPREGERVLDTVLERLEVDALARALPDADADLSEVTFRRGEGTTQEGLYFDDPNREAAIDAAERAAREAGVGPPEAGLAVVGDADGVGGREAGNLTSRWTEGADVGRALAELALQADVMELAENAPAGTRRLRVFAPPPPSGATAAAVGAAPRATGWSFVQEAFVNPYRLDPSDRAALASARDAQPGVIDE